MKESQFLGSLLPTSPDFLSIVQEFREKYGLPELSPDDDPIKEIYLGDQIIPLEQFRQEICDRLESDPKFTPDPLGKFYIQAKTQLGKPLDMTGYELLPDEFKETMVAVHKLTQEIMRTIAKVVGQYFERLTQMIYVYLLTGETEELLNDWISMVVPLELSGEPVVVAFATQVANPDLIVQQFREAYAKTFGSRHPRVTNTMVSTVYYMRLQREKKPWKYIVEEYIRLNNFQLPRDQHSKRYVEVWKMYSERLKKRIQRSEATLDVLVRDIK